MVSEEELAAVLRHCRELAAAADELHRLTMRRGEAARQALRSWRGPSADEFAARLVDEDDLAGNGVVLLRAEAEAWARAWADAVNETNAHRWAEASATIGSGLPTGPASPTPVAVPRAETGYAPTGGLSRPSPVAAALGGS